MTTPSSSTAAEPLDRAAAFERHRPRLFGIAYRMLGTVPDAEDLLQTAYLRWHEADGASVQNPEAWLVAVTSRLAIDRLRQATGERKRYVGDWLPEPIAIREAPPTDARSELASDLSMAFLVLLERLSPDERAALLLHDVFGAGYDEVARVLERSEAACRQVVHRARARVRDGRTRFTVPVEAKQQLVARFLEGMAANDERALLELVAEDATWTSDGGGKAFVAHRLRGSARIVRFLVRLSRKAGDRMRRELAWINGEPAFVTYLDGRLFSTTSIATDGERAVAFYAVVNPDKLQHLELPRPA